MATGTIRDAVDAADVGVAAALAAVLYLLGLEAGAIAAFVGLVVGRPVLDAAVEATGLEVDPGVAGVALGAIVVAAGAVQVRTGNSLLGWILVAIGGWIALDGVDRWHNGSPDDGTVDEDDLSNEEVFLVGEHNRWLLETLREADRPLTAAEIQDRTGLTEDDFMRLLEFHGESGPIERVGNGYALDERELGAATAARAVARTIWGRLRRPLRLLRPFG